jgi:asparagine synthase (glutamine-hydrolysing)
MCGFVGLINKTNTKVDPQLLKTMAETLKHRGPDDEGSFIDNNIGFYHKRLSIIDLNSGHQPMSFGNYTLIFNGEIYNYIELREELKSKGHKFVTKSDTEVIIRMYDEYGIDFINLLNGMFAFLLYDKKQKKIIAARDHFGIKPLYYYDDDNLLVFTSEIKAILKHNKIKAEPDYESLYEYLTFQYVLNDKTLFKNIFKILPGHYGVYDLKSKNFDQIKYWHPSFKIDTYHTEEYFIHEIRKLLENTIDIQLRSDVPVGTYLSGGFDSSIVTIFASKKYNGRLKTFTGAFNEAGGQFDETRYSREVAAACNAEIFEVFPSENDFIDLLPKLIYYLDEPVAGPGVFPQYMVSKLASENVKVVLGGQGGDEIFGGYARYVIAYLEQAIKGTICETNEEGEHIVSLTSILPNLSYLKNYIPMIKEFNKDGMFENMGKRYFKLIDRKNGDEELFSGTFNNNYCKNYIYEKFEKIFNNPDTLSYYNKMTHFDMTTSLPALLHVEDRMSMAASIESRVPFLDKRIVDLIISMPAGMKFKGAEMKYILKKSITDILPETILNRKDKMGFPVPLHLWAKNGTSNFIGDILLSKASAERGIYNISKVEKLISSERAFGRKLWGILSLELWFQTFIDKN